MFVGKAGSSKPMSQNFMVCFVQEKLEGYLKICQIFSRNLMPILITSFRLLFAYNKGFLKKVTKQTNICCKLWINSTLTPTFFLSKDKEKILQLRLRREKAQSYELPDFKCEHSCFHVQFQSFFQHDVFHVGS